MKKPITQIIADMEKGDLCCDPLSTAVVVQYEAAVACQNVFYSLVRDTPGSEIANAHKDYAKTEFADLIMQIRVLTHLMGISYEELETLGEERLYDTLEKLASRGAHPTQNLKANLAPYKPFSSTTLPPMMPSAPRRVVHQGD